LTPPSLLNGSSESVAVATNGHLSLPSPPQSRNSSAQGSYATSTTTIEDNSDEARGKTADGTPKDGKGNVIVSVRIRPNIVKDLQSEGEWVVDTKRALITYKGREGGDYIYGMLHNMTHVSDLD
jgi:centromeric protein E